MNQEWYKNTQTQNDNKEFYTKFIETAENLMFSDVEEELVIVNFVNSSRKILNFIGSENKYGFFKYEGFIKNVQIGDCLKVRFHNGKTGDIFRIYTLKTAIDDEFKSLFIKNVEGKLLIPQGKNHGFVNQVFVHPEIITKNNLQNDDIIKGYAIKSFNKAKENWNWKLFRLKKTIENNKNNQS
jgi:hypothetical protein